MGRFIQQTSFLQSLLFMPFRMPVSPKVFRLRNFSLMIFFCMSGDGDFDFIEKKFASATPKHDARSASVLTSSTDYFRSYQSGNWSLNSTWESSPDNINWQMATEIPTKDANRIWIQSTHSVFVSNAISLDEVSVAGILELRTGGILNINDGVGDDITILENGMLRVISTDKYNDAIKQATGAVINIATGGTIMLGNSISFIGIGYEGFATSSDNTWNDGAVFEYNNNGVFAIADLTYFPNAAASETPIFRVTKVLGIAANGIGKNFNLKGLFELNTDVSFSGAGGRYFRNGIRGTATLSQTGAGKFYLTAPSAILAGSPLKIVLSAVFDLSLVSTIIPNDANIIITGANISNKDALLTVNGTLDLSNYNITNTNGSIVINGIYRTTHPGGFSGTGSSIVAGNININAGSTIELYASGTQSLNARSDFKNIILSGSGTKTPNGPFNPAGTVIIKDDAVFDCTGKNIGDETFGLPSSTNLTMSGNSRLIVSTFGPNPKMGGVYNLTGGIVEFKCTNLTPQTIRSKNYQNIEITGTNVLMSAGKITLNDLGTFKVKNGAIFTANDNTIEGTTGSQTVIVESGGLFRCGTNKGFHGFTITPIPIKSSAINSDIEHIILEPNSTVEYSRSNPPLADGDQPITNTNGLIYQNLILSGTGNKTAPTGDLIIQGNLSKTGSCNFIHNDGTVIFNGGNAQTYNASSPRMLFNNLTNKNISGLEINGGLSVYKKLLFADNSITNLNAGITLKSDKNQTASVAKIPLNAAFNYNTGYFVVERFINSGSLPGGHGKSWQLLSSSVFGETIFNTWQESGDNVIANFGTWITDPLGTTFGFDGTSISPSIKTFSSLNQSWEGISNTNLDVADPQGYFVYVRGDRTVRGLSNSATPVTLRTWGKLFRGDQPSINVVANSYQSIGNPYASAIDFSKLITSNIDHSFYVWDPSIQGSYNAGGYQTISATTGFIAVPGASTIYASNADYRNIQSSQAFMVHNSSAVNGSIQFTEDCKMADGHHLVNREGAERQMFFASLYNKEGLLVDGNAVVFDEDFSNNTDGHDAVKMQNGGENFAIERNSKNFAIEARQPVSRPDTVFYDLHNLNQQEYRLVFVPKNMSGELRASLTDRFLNTETTISLNDSTWVNFSITSDAASYASDRFSVVFLPEFAERGLPLLFISVNAWQKNKKILVEWKVGNDKNIDHYEIEHSVDGVQFLLRDDKNALGLNEGVNSYLDESPINGNNFYRIRGIDKNGKSLISPVAKVFLERFKPGISIFPNPVDGEIIRLRFIGQQVGKYLMTLYNSSGEVLRTKTLYHTEGSENHSLMIKKNLPRGIYILEITGPGEIKEFLKVVK